MKTDDELQAEVSEELRFEPRVEASEIAAFADDGVVTLRGTVGSLGAKHAATKAAQRVAGVRSVDNNLEVRILTEHRRDDADLRGSVLKALSWNASVPEDVNATVKDGVVTLTGTVDSRHQRDEAVQTVRSMTGVAGIDDEILVRSPAMAADVTAVLQKAFQRNAQLEAARVNVEAVDGTVTLTGSVDTWAEHDAALAAAWAAPGVHDVNDELEITYVY